MNRRGFAPIIILLLIAGILIAGGAWYYKTHGLASQMPTAQVSPSSVTASPAPVISMATPDSCKNLYSYQQSQCYEQVAVANKDLSTCDKIADALRGYCYAKVAGAVSDINICYKISSLSAGEECFNNVAVAKNDLSVCDAIRASNPFYVIEAGAHNNCYAAVAAARNDVSLCAKVTGASRDQCYNTVATLTHAPATCANIVDSAKRTFCMSGAAPLGSDGAACDSQTGVAKDQCLMSAAIHSSSTALCGKLSNQNFIQGCYSQIALSTKNPSDCGGISDLAARDICYLQIAGSSQSTDICAKIASSTIQAKCQVLAVPPTAATCDALPPMGNHISMGASSAGCYINLAQYYHDDSYCLSVPNIYGARSYCYDQGANYTLDPATCDKINGTSTQDASNKNQCYQMVGSELGDINSCLKITDENPYGYKYQCLNAVEVITRSTSTCATLNGDLRNTCYANIAYEQGDIGLCSSIQSSTSSAQCVRQVAILKNDTSLCMKIPSGIDRDFCYDSIGTFDQNPSACANITNAVSQWPTSYPPSQPDCYISVAGASKDAAVCSNIIDSKARTTCLDIVQHGN